MEKNHFPSPNYNVCTFEVWAWINFYLILYHGCIYLSRLGLKLIHVNEGGFLYQSILFTGHLVSLFFIGLSICYLPQLYDLYLSISYFIYRLRTKPSNSRTIYANRSKPDAYNITVCYSCCDSLLGIQYSRLTHDFLAMHHFNLSYVISIQVVWKISGVRVLYTSF